MDKIRQELPGIQVNYFPGPELPDHQIKIFPEKLK
jgi:hypothetical protein